MKKTIYVGLTSLLICASLSSFLTNHNSESTKSTEKSNTRISFKIRGTGSKGISVKIGIGTKVGTGSCCSTVSPNTTSSFSGEIGDVVYDSERKRVITQIYDDLEGQTIELKNYY
jgi:hypothetical protein